RDMDPDVGPSALELEIVVTREVVGERPQPSRGLLPRHRLFLLDLQNVHHSSYPLVVSCPLAILSSAPTLCQNRAGTAADGGAPGCRRATRTRSTPGRIRNSSGGLSVTASPSIPAGTGRSDRTSNSGTDHSRQGRCARRWLPPPGAATTVTPSMPSSIRGRVPDP